MKTETRQCKKCKENFSLDRDDFSFYEKMDVPAPKICPDCRFKNLALWRNEMTLYSGKKCDLCGKNILSMYNPKSSFKVYCYECYMSDNWDPKSFQEEYKKDEPFLKQLKEFFLKVPKCTTFLSTNDGPNINSDYANMAGGMKNCYMFFNGAKGEEVRYSRGTRFSKETSDSYFGDSIERCYECVNVHKSNGLFYARNTYDSMDSVFVLNCSGLNNCFGCVNLKNKSYHYFNEPLKREEYFKKLNEILGSYSRIQEFQKKFDEFSLKFPRRENNNLKTVNSVGDFLLECKNVQNGFEVVGAEDSKYILFTRNNYNSRDIIGFGYKSELLLGCVAVGYSSKVISSFNSNGSKDILYSLNLRNCHDCIGCDGLKNSSFCIFNKQYSENDYKELKDFIIEELKRDDLYGIVSSELAPFAYNETIAQDNMPLTKKEALKQGFRWEDNIQKTEGKETIKPEEIPDHIKDVPDSITKEILKCIDCNRNYKIIEQELLFYRKLILPIPRKCFYCRHKDRVIRRGPYKFWDRKCSKCDKNIKTNYSPESPEIVYCEKCYQKEVY